MHGSKRLANFCHVPHGLGTVDGNLTDVLSVIQNEVRQFLPQSGELRHLESAVHGLIIILAQFDIAGQHIALMMLVDNKVGDGCFHVETCGSADGRAAAVNLDGNIVDISHVADLLYLGETAAVRESAVPGKIYPRG